MLVPERPRLIGEVDTSRLLSERDRLAEFVDERGDVDVMHLPALGQVFRAADDDPEEAVGEAVEPLDLA